jgi:hypothetical protein
MTDNILSKNIVDKWIKEVMEYEYILTVHARDCPFPEKLMRMLQQEGWRMTNVTDNRFVVTANDPVALASLSLRLSKRGYLIED